MTGVEVRVSCLLVLVRSVLLVRFVLFLCVLFGVFSVVVVVVVVVVVFVVVDDSRIHCFFHPTRQELVSRALGHKGSRIQPQMDKDQPGRLKVMHPLSQYINICMYVYIYIYIYSI